MSIAVEVIASADGSGQVLKITTNSNRRKALDLSLPLAQGQGSWSDFARALEKALNQLQGTQSNAS